MPKDETGASVPKQKKEKAVKQPKPKKPPVEPLEGMPDTGVTRQTITVDIKLWKDMREAAKGKRQTISKFCDVALRKAV